jgi:hypothetical protein
MSTNHAGKTVSHVWIGSIDEGQDSEGSATVKAQFNPGTIEISQNVPWKKPDAASKGGGQQKGPPKDENYNALEFTGAEGRSMTLELLFDAFEAGSDDVQTNVHKLEMLAAVRGDPSKGAENERRPHHCVVVWGTALQNFRKDNFKCVIESLTTKYTMFSPEGKPLRATCTVKLKEAAKVDRKK